MKSILLIAPYQKMAVLARKITSTYDDVDVRLGLVEDAVQIARDAERQGVEAFISRGGTALALQKANLESPIVEIPVHPYDLLQAIYRAKKIGRNIAVIGFENIIREVDKLGPILEVNIKTYRLSSKEEAGCYLPEILASSPDVLLGGTTAEELAVRHGIPTVLLETGEQAIEQSIQEARRSVAIKRKEKEKTEEVKAILHNISEGVVAVDREGRVITYNTAAEKITGIQRKDITGKIITDIIKNSRLLRVIKQNKEELGQFQTFGNTLVLTNRVPVIVKGKTVGAVATFENVTKIQEYEQKIRSTLLSKGHVARYSFADIIGCSPAIRQTIIKAKKYAGVDSTLLITGESGTGKEMFAQSIHSASNRGKGPFVAVNCAAIPENLLESELFGYEGGAFTGARKEGRPGLFLQAHGGTIFLDEIGEINIELQTRLLRVLQEREIRPLGSDRVIPIDVRVMAATNKNLLQEVNKGFFRRDLYYRINILNLRIPSLAERLEDIPLLFLHFIQTACNKLQKKLEIQEEALNFLANYDWPGNIRELENAAERVAVLCENLITPEHLLDVMGEVEGLDETLPLLTLKDLEIQAIRQTLERCGGNKTLAARQLGISRTHLWRMLNKINLPDVT